MIATSRPTLLRPGSGPAIGDTMIETRALRRTFKTRAGVVEAVKGVDLRVATGELFGFLGPNGAARPPRCACWRR